MLRKHVAMEIWWNDMRAKLDRDEGASLVETLVWAGAIAVAAVAIVAMIRIWAARKVNALP